MNALSTISIVVIETVSEASARRAARRSGMPARNTGTQRERVAEGEREGDRERDRGGVPPAERRRDHHPEHLADGAAGEAVRRRKKRAPAQGRRSVIHGSDIPR